MADDQQQRLEGLAAGNFMGLKGIEVDFTSCGELIIFGGDNGAGKSSTLAVLTACLYGAQTIPDVPIHEGAEGAWAESRFTDLIVRREWKPGKRPGFSVKKKDGTRLEPPGEFLKRMFGAEAGVIPAFDPARFMTMKPQEIVEVCTLAAGIDPAEFKRQRDEIYAKRTGVNAAVKQLDGMIAGIPPAEVPEKLIDLGEFSREMERISAENKGHEAQRNAARNLLVALRGAQDARRTLADRVEGMAAQIDDLMRQHASLSRDLETADDQLTKREAEAEQAALDAEALVDTPLSAVSQRISEAEGTNAKIREQQRRGELWSQREAKDSESVALTKALVALDVTREKALQAAEFGVEGLAFRDGDLLFRGRPFAQASTGEKAEIAIYLASALNPKAPAIIFDEGSLFDQTTLDRIRAAAERVGKLVLMGRVGHGSEATFILSGGELEGKSSE